MAKTDTRAPAPTSDVTTKVMRANKGKDTGPEKEVRRILREMGYPGYRLNWRKAPGHPDIAYPGRRIAIFVNGCFWHRCPRCDLPLPKSHTEFWQAKFDRNVARDAEKTRALEELGWTVVTIWECELKDPDAVRERLSALFPRPPPEVLPDHTSYVGVVQPEAPLRVVAASERVRVHLVAAVRPDVCDATVR